MEKYNEKLNKGKKLKEAFFMCHRIRNAMLPYPPPNAVHYQVGRSDRTSAKSYGCSLAASIQEMAVSRHPHEAHAEMAFRPPDLAYSVGSSDRFRIQSEPQRGQ